MKKIALALLLVLIFTLPAVAANTCTTKEGFLFALTEEDFDYGFSVLMSGDEAAFAKLIAQDRIGFLKPGIPAYIVKFKMFSGTMSIRPIGYNLILWTVLEACQ